MEYCSKCGNPLEPDAKFCGTCGQVAQQSGQTPPVGYSTGLPQQTSKPKRSKKGIVVVGIVVIAVIIAALLLSGPIMGGSTNGHPAGQIYNGSYLTFTITGTSLYGLPLSGTETLTFNNVTATSYSLKQTTTFNGVSSSTSSNYQMSNGDWTSTFSLNSYSVTPTLVGQESIQTNYGQKTTYHYSESNIGGTIGFWKDTGNQIIYQLSYYDTAGDSLTWKLTGTNMI
jgi:hypothetical protein